MTAALQKLYNLDFVAGGIVCAGLLIIFALSSLSLLDVDGDLMLTVLSVVVAVFLSLNLFLYSRGKKKTLSLPSFLSSRLHKCLAVILLTTFVSVIAYGLYAWRYAPLKPDGARFIDKRGRSYTSQQYESFKRWEVALMAVGGTFAVFVITSLPSYRGRFNTVNPQSGN